MKISMTNMFNEYFLIYKCNYMNNLDYPPDNCDEITDFMGNVNDIPCSLPTDTNWNPPREPVWNEPTRKATHFDPSTIMDAAQIPGAQITHTENNNGQMMPWVLYNNVSYPITSFVPSVINQIQERQNNADQYDHMRVKREQERLALEREQMALERERRLLNNQDKHFDKGIRHSEPNEYCVDPHCDNRDKQCGIQSDNLGSQWSILTSMTYVVGDWKKSVLVLVLILLFMNSYVNTFISIKIPYIDLISNSHLNLFFFACIVTLIYHILSRFI